MKIYKMRNKVPPIDTDICITDSTGKRTMPDENSWEVDKEPSFQFKHYDYRVHKAVYCPYCRSDDEVLRAKEYDITDNVPVVKAYFCEDCEKTFYTTE